MNSSVSSPSKHPPPSTPTPTGHSICSSPLPRQPQVSSSHHMPAGEDSCWSGPQAHVPGPCSLQDYSCTAAPNYCCVVGRDAECWLGAGGMTTTRAGRFLLRRTCTLTAPLTALARYRNTLLTFLGQKCLHVDESCLDRVSLA